MDVSFISVLKILPALKAIPGGLAPRLALIKPQFEAGPEGRRQEGRRPRPGRPRRGPGAGRRRGPGARLRARGPHPLLDARAEGQRRVLRPVGQGGAGPQRGRSSQPGSRRRSAMNNVRKAGIVIKPHAPSVEGILKIVVEYFEGRGIACAWAWRAGGDPEGARGRPALGVPLGADLPFLPDLDPGDQGPGQLGGQRLLHGSHRHRRLARELGGLGRAAGSDNPLEGPACGRYTSSCPAPSRDLFPRCAGALRRAGAGGDRPGQQAPAGLVRAGAGSRRGDAGGPCDPPSW